MPRGRKTRGAGTARPKPQLPEGQEGEALTPSQRRAKLDLFLKDFDQEVKSRIKVMRKEGKNMVDTITLLFKAETMKIPREVQNMKYIDFMQAGGSVDKGSMTVFNEIDSQIEAKLATVVKPKAPAPSQMETISEEGEGNENEKPTKTTRKRGQRTVAAKPAPASARPRRTANARSRQFQTPFGGASANGWETPLVTPKFDPRLPVTPAPTRNRKPGEPVHMVTYSMHGSPLANTEPEVTLLDRQKTLCLSAVEGINPGQLKNLDKETVEKLRLINQQLNSFFQQVQGTP